MPKIHSCLEKGFCNAGVVPFLSLYGSLSKLYALQVGVFFKRNPSVAGSVWHPEVGLNSSGPAHHPSVSACCTGQTPCFRRVCRSVVPNGLQPTLSRAALEINFIKRFPCANRAAMEYSGGKKVPTQKCSSDVPFSFRISQCPNVSGVTVTVMDSSTGPTWRSQNLTVIFQWCSLKAITFPFRPSCVSQCCMRPKHLQYDFILGSFPFLQINQINVPFIQP